MSKKEIKFTPCVDCGKHKPLWYVRCYSCHMKHLEPMGVIRSLFLFVWLPCIPTIFSKTIEVLLGLGMSLYLSILSVIGIILILVIYKYQELENIFIQFKKENWW